MQRLGWVILAMMAATPAAAVDTVVPYQHTGSLNTPCPNAQCIITFPAIPAGQRLVLTGVSAQVGGTIQTIILEGGSASYFVARNIAGGDYLTQPVTLFYEAGQAPRARMFALNVPANTSLFVTLAGYLVPQK